MIATSQASEDVVSLNEKLAEFQKAFPDKVVHASLKNVVFADGTTVVTNDGQKKSHAEKLKRADIEDMLWQIYPIGECAKTRPPRDFDPGRIRSDRVMRALFGANRSAAAANQVRVPWFGQRLRFSRVSGADTALKRVARKLADITKQKPSLSRFLRPSAGTFIWRKIAGTDRLSAHSFGAAIDINTKFADYWRWSGGKPGNVPRYRNKIPDEIVKAFESRGFIWGGRWYHFDTMHFEYRPDLIAIGRLAKQRGCSKHFRNR